MKLKYEGPKEIISPNGISFKTSKDDKYIYIKDAMQLYTSIHENLSSKSIVQDDFKELTLNDEEILEEILKIKKDFFEIYHNEINLFKETLDTEIEQVKQKTDLNEVEKTSYKNNLVMMKNYRVQREKNRIIFKQVISILIEELKKSEIKEISLAFSTKMLYIFKTISEDLSKENIENHLEENINEQGNITLKI